MPGRIQESIYYQEEILDRAARDDDRESHSRRPRPRLNLRERYAFQAAVIDGVNTAATASTRLSCPGCHGAVCVPADSDREEIECAGCDMKLVTRQTIGGVAVDRTEGRPR